jgi:predicted  nucleic acid-binding Zn-ribbon protein
MMNPDLEGLIRLQALDVELQNLKRTIDGEGERRLAIESALDAGRQAVAAVRERLSENQAARRAIEKDLAQVQSRLSRYKDQLMEVKTNREYAAVQSEIAVAGEEVRKFEDRILESLVAADDVAAELKAAEAELKAAEAESRTAIQALAAETQAAQQRLSTATAARADLARALPRPVLDLFEHIASHRGAAVVEARDGHCSVCHVRLRPKVFQDVRRNDTILRCDSCQRILYYVPPVASQTAHSATS